MSAAHEQPELPFDGSRVGPDGHSLWQKERQELLNRLARDLGLPLGHEAEVVLKDGIVLRGRLLLCEDELWIEPRRDLRVMLRVARCTFAATEIEACVRLD